MAQVDTGLGWSADGEWLAQSGIKLADIMSSGGGGIPELPGQPVPYFQNTPTAAQVVSGGLYGGYYRSRPSNFCGADVEGLFISIPATTSFITYYAVLRAPYTTNQISVTFYSTSGSGDGTLHEGTSVLDWDANNQLYVGIVHAGATIVYSNYALVPYLGSGIQPLIDLVNSYVVLPLYKKNQGYAIACCVNWRDTVSTRETAVLISTNEEFVKFTTDQQTEYPYSYTSIQRYQGITFYMSYVRLNDRTIIPSSAIPHIDLSSVLVSMEELFLGICGPSFANVIVTAPPEPYDPYEPGGTSDVGGGGGTFDDSSDVIGIPTLPALSFAATGFTRIYNPTLTEINSLANYLWTDNTFLDTVVNHLKQLIENPIDAIISLSLLPCPIPNGTPEAVKVMYVNTGVTMAPATTQFVDVDCGTFALEEYYGSALDYNPYTKIHCYLPYIGQVTLDADEVMGKTLQVKYRIDIVTGMCAAMILVDQTVLYQFSGHCAINMPINSADFSGYIAAAMTAGKMVAGVVAGATGNIPLAAELIGAPAPHSSTTETVEKTTVRNPQTGRQVTSGTNTKIAVHKTPGASFGEMARKATSNTVGAVMNSKMVVGHAGGFTGNSGYLAVRRPYLIIERPRMCNPEEYGKYNGRPSMIYMSLDRCVGYTEVQSIQFSGISATNPEMAELSELLKSGVIF